MKSRRRHELQDNVLRIELAKAADLFRKYGTYIVWGGVVAALVLLVATYSISKSRQRRRDIHVRYVQATTDRTIKLDDRLEDLKALAEQDINRDIAAEACLRVGDLSASRLVTGGSSTLKIERKGYRDQAETYYRKAIAGFGDRPTIVGRAHLGLALLAESWRDFDAAEAEYRVVLATPELRGGPLADAATRGIETLDELRLAVAMATTAPAPRKKDKKDGRPGNDF